MTIITLHHLCFGHYVKLSVVVLIPQFLSLGAVLPQKNTSAKNNHLQFHTMTSKKMVRNYCLIETTTYVYINMMIRSKKKMFVCPFPTDPKFLKTWVAFFFFLIFNFAFSNKIVEIIIFKVCYNCPKS